jgi:hypothetical protein
MFDPLLAPCLGFADVCFHIYKGDTTTCRDCQGNDNPEPSWETRMKAGVLWQAIAGHLGFPAWETQILSIDLLNQEGIVLKMLGHYVLTTAMAKGDYPHRVRVGFRLGPSSEDWVRSGNVPSISVDMFITRGESYSDRAYEFDINSCNRVDEDAAKLLLKEWCKDGGYGVKHFQGVLVAANKEDHIDGLLIQCLPSDDVSVVSSR